MKWNEHNLFEWNASNDKNVVILKFIWTELVVNLTIFLEETNTNSKSHVLMTSEK